MHTHTNHVFYATFDCVSMLTLRYPVTQCVTRRFVRLIIMRNTLLTYHKNVHSIVLLHLSKVLTARYFSAGIIVLNVRYANYFVCLFAKKYLN
jgi:hypothetical protein